MKRLCVECVTAQHHCVPVTQLADGTRQFVCWPCLRRLHYDSFMNLKKGVTP